MVRHGHTLNRGRRRRSRRTRRTRRTRKPRRTRYKRGGMEPMTTVAAGAVLGAGVLGVAKKVRDRRRRRRLAMKHIDDIPMGPGDPRRGRGMEHISHMPGTPGDTHAAALRETEDSTDPLEKKDKKKKGKKGTRSSPNWSSVADESSSLSESVPEVDPSSSRGRLQVAQEELQLLKREQQRRSRSFGASDADRISKMQAGYLRSATAEADAWKHGQSPPLMRQYAATGRQAELRKVANPTGTHRRRMG